MTTPMVTQRLKDWQQWQALECEFASALLEEAKVPYGQQYDEAERAQKLLALRWYLLEGFRLRLVEAMRAENTVLDTSNLIPSDRRKIGDD